MTDVPTLVGALRSAPERAHAFFFGHDVFLSYCYGDSAYGVALALALQKQKIGARTKLSVSSRFP
jgi:hypothetical protein